MTGHHAGKRPRQAPPADPLLDQLAAHIAAARTTGNPAIAALANAETAFTANMLTRLEGLDAPTIGAVLLAAGYYAGEFLKTLRAEDTAGAPAAVVNLVQLAGQQLYVARVASKGVCGLAWPSGKACTQTFEADDDETLAAKMRGHAALSHPGQEWAAHAGEEPGDVIIAGDGGPGTLSDATGRTWPATAPRPKHAPHELCDCRPGETYHCAADGEAQS